MLPGVAAAWLVASLWSAPARADGGIPRAYGILFEPGNPSHIVVRSQYWGVFDGHVGSSSWSLLCSQAYGGRALDPDNYPTVLAQGGRILVASQFSGLNISDDNCNWTQLNVFGGAAVQAVASMDAVGKSLIAVTVAGDAAGVTSRIFTSGDRGDTWTPVRATIPWDVSMASVAVAPSDRRRIYVVGVSINGGPRQIAVSKDGGGSFATLPLGDTKLYDPTLLKPLSVAGILPNDPDTLFVRADGGDMVGAMADDELWMSRDAGSTWSLVLTAMGDLPGFALTPDGNSVLVSGPSMGIQRASLADVFSGQGAGAFTKIYMGQVWALAFQGNDLYAGNDDYNMKPSFTLGVSKDGGITFQKVMTKCDVGFPECGMSSTMEMLCREQWTRQGGYVTDYLEAACAQNGVPPTGTGGGGAVNGAGGSASVIGAGADGSGGGTSSKGAQSRSNDAGLADSGTGNQHGTPADGAGNPERHVGLRSIKCSVDAAHGAHSHLTTWLVSGAAGLGAIRRRRFGKRR